MIFLPNLGQLSLGKGWQRQGKETGLVSGHLQVCRESQEQISCPFPQEQQPLSVSQLSIDISVLISHRLCLRDLYAMATQES